MTNIYRILLEKHCSKIAEQIIDEMRKSKVITRNIGDKIVLTLDDANELLKEMSTPCLYRWWAHESSVRLILSNCNRKSEFRNLLGRCERDEDGYYLLYFGKSNDGRNRIINQHLKGDVKKSTLRHTLYSLCREGKNFESEKDVDKLFENSYFEWLPVEEKCKEYIVALESICIALGYYPLNIDGNPTVDEKWLAYLKEARKQSKKNLSPLHSANIIKQSVSI